MEVFSYLISSSYICVGDSWDKALLHSNERRKKKNLGEKRTKMIPKVKIAKPMKKMRKGPWEHMLQSDWKAETILGLT